MAQSITKIKAEGIALAINQILGFRPTVVYSENYAEIKFTPDQERIARAWIENQMSKKGPPGDIRINLVPIVLPLLLTKAFPFLAGAAGVGYFFGKKTKKGY